MLGIMLMGLFGAVSFAAICNVWEYYNPEGDICEDCVAWNYCPGDDQIYACPGGTYSNSINATSCASCGPGTYASAGASNCSACIPGTYEPVWWVASCSLCAPGTYTNSLWSTQCSPCPANTFSRYAGAPLCAPCRDGTTSAPGATTCTPIGWWVESYTFVKMPLSTWSVASGTIKDNLKTIVKKKIKRVIRLRRK